jgi:uncharacterized phiE125 gp8 family phage protein
MRYYRRSPPPPSLHLVTGPTAEPVTLARAKLHLRVDHAADDALIAAQIAAARTHVETVTGHRMLPQTWRLDLDAVPTEADLYLPLRPVTAISSVVYRDALGQSQTWASSAYRTLLPAGTPTVPARIHAIDGWPDVDEGPAALSVTFVAGYADPASVPETLLAAVLLLVGSMYMLRESEVLGTTVAENPTVAALLAPYRVAWVA